MENKRYVVYICRYLHVRIEYDGTLFEFWVDLAMGRPLDPNLISSYAEAFAKQEALKHRGFAVLLDISGKLFKGRKPTLKDVEGNTEVGKIKSRILMYICKGICVSTVHMWSYVHVFAKIRSYLDTNLFIYFCFMKGFFLFTISYYGGNKWWFCHKIIFAQNACPTPCRW